MHCRLFSSISPLVKTTTKCLQILPKLSWRVGTAKISPPTASTTDDRETPRIKDKVKEPEQFLCSRDQVLETISTKQLPWNESALTIFNLLWLKT